MGRKRGRAGYSWKAVDTDLEDEERVSVLTIYAF